MPAESFHPLLGDPLDPVEPFGHASILDADEREEIFAAGERFLDRHALLAELVPAELGGRLVSFERLIVTMRSVARHDMALWLSYFGSAFIGSTNVWAAGTPGQRRTVAGLLLRNGKLAVAYHELEHGTDLLRVGFNALPSGDGWIMNGRKEVIANVDRAEKTVLFARTDPQPGLWSHSQFLIDNAAAVREGMRYLPRFHTSGMRGVRLTGVELAGCPVPGDCVLGAPGGGVDTVLRSFPITRVVISGTAVASLDTGLRLALRFALDRRRGPGRVADLAVTRRLLCDTFIDLLVCDAIASVAARALQITPAESHLYSAAVKFLVPRLAMDAMRRLSTLLGAHFYLREGPHALFQKHLRDLAPAVFGHLPRAACQSLLLPYLPRLARHAWAAPEDPDSALFRLREDLPSFPLGKLPPAAARRDPLIAALTLTQQRLRGTELAGLVDALAGELAALRRECAAMRPHRLTVTADTAALATTSRYAALLAASACLNIWWHHRAADVFVGDPRWVAAALRRLLAGVPRHGLLLGERGDHTPWLYAELVRRFEEGRSFDLSDQPLR
ncbi:acyl-CoA dehydrogenase [Nonomuraea sp. NPDC050202]|uniref:acyl-CoA dehydrogenase n=1 Tax=Nonomuraea sp. NPDC050202 TaxID=3155035 RepID=UPI0034002956